MKTLPALLTATALALALASSRADEFNSAGVKIHYTVEGKGEPVILIHGLYSSAAVNWQWPGTVAELAKQYQVIALDNRGHGQSDKPQAEGEYGVKMAEDIVRLMDHLHIARAHVVGYSLGGMIVMKLLTTHPERVSSAVLGGMGWLQEGSPLQHFWEAIKGGDKARDSQAVPVACLRGMAGLAVTEKEVKAVRVPVDIIVGDHDPCRQLYVEPLRKIRPDWPEHVIAGAGHLICIFKPDFKAQVKSALDRHSALAGSSREGAAPKSKMNY
jgi:pimeloyl-ACP methyl ester carboxylesterase